MSNLECESNRITLQEIKENKALDTELSNALKSIVVAKKNDFVRLKTLKYKEVLPVLITYKGVLNTGIDIVKLEVMLRTGHDVIIGKNKNNVLCILGYVTTSFYESNASNVFDEKTINYEDITFIVKDKVKPEKEGFEEISNHNNCTTGKFVVIRNKVLNYVNDFDLIEYYIDTMAEIMLSRYSIILQTRVNTFLKGQRGDETINQVLSDVYNAMPFPKVTDNFEIEDSIHTINSNFGGVLEDLKRELQHQISELNNEIGIQSLAVDKASGVNEVESKSNHASTSANANLYIKGRNEPLKKLNKRFGTEIIAMYDDNVISEMSIIGDNMVKEVGK